MEQRQLSIPYYKLMFSDTNPQAMISRKWDIKNIDRWFVYKGLRVENWPKDVVFYTEGDDLEDYLLCTLPEWMLVSERVRRVIEAYSTESVQFLPVRIVHKEKQVEFEPYWLLNVVCVVEALDWEQTRWFHPERKYEDEYPILDIVKVALKGDAIKGVDIFRLKVKENTGLVYVSLRIKRALEIAEATSGFKFIEAPVY